MSYPSKQGRRKWRSRKAKATHHKWMRQVFRSRLRSAAKEFAAVFNQAADRSPFDDLFEPIEITGPLND